MANEDAMGRVRIFAWARDLYHWKRWGLLGPLPLLGENEVARIKSAVEAQYSRSGVPSTRNRHIDLPVLDALCEDADFWRPVHDVLGGELLLWRTNMFLADPRLPWHEDRHSEAFEGDAPSFSTLLAMDDLPSQSCTVFVPGSHRLTVPEKERKFGISATYRESGNIRYAGRVAERFRVPLPLKAGEAVLFHPHLLHASGSYARDGCRTSRERMILTFRDHHAGGGAARQRVSGGERGRRQGAALPPSSFRDGVLEQRADPARPPLLMPGTWDEGIRPVIGSRSVPAEGMGSSQPVSALRGRHGILRRRPFAAPWSRSGHPFMGGADHIATST